MTRLQMSTIAASGSAALLVGAFAFQHLGGLAPCNLCIWQRYPHAVAVALGVLVLFLPLPALIVLGAVAAFSSAAIGLYHVGVEQGWWDGPAACSGGAPATMSAGDLFDQIMAAPLVRCDDIPWEFGGLSMAGWNMVLSLILACLWIEALRRR